MNCDENCFTTARIDSRAQGETRVDGKGCGSAGWLRQARKNVRKDEAKMGFARLRPEQRGRVFSICSGDAVDVVEDEGLHGDLPGFQFQA